MTRRHHVRIEVSSRGRNTPMLMLGRPGALRARVDGRAAASRFVVGLRPNTAQTTPERASACRTVRHRRARRSTTTLPQARLPRKRFQAAQEPGRTRRTTQPIPYAMAATKFAFEERTAPVDWPRVASADVRRLEKLGDVVALREFLADVCVGDIDDGFVDYESERSQLEMKALRTSQLAAQYLLYAQHVLASRKATLEKGHERLKKAEILERRRYEKRRDRVKLLEEELASQNRLCETHESVLKSIDPILASRVSRDDSGRVVVAAAPPPPSAAADVDDAASDTSSVAPAPLFTRGGGNGMTLLSLAARQPVFERPQARPMDLTIPAGTELPLVAGNPEATQRL